MTYTETKKEKVNLQVNDMFSTPESSKALHEYLGKFHGNEGVIAITCATLMYNYLVSKYDMYQK